MKNFNIQHDGQVLTATITRPKALNALNVEVMEEARGLIQDFYDNDEIRGLILDGDGEKAFVAGADIKELAILNREQALELAKKGQSLYKKIEDCPKPIIAAINGFALGGDAS
jgi:enoyl-CoA hydratase